MKVASVADIKARLSAYLKASAEGPVVVTRNGKAVAVLIAVADAARTGTFRVSGGSAARNPE
jgi:prevent-host-death family protein